MLFSGERPRGYEDWPCTLEEVAPAMSPARNDQADLILPNVVLQILKPAEKKKPNGSRPVTPPRNMVTKQAKK